MLGNMPEKDPAAVALGKKRWEGKSEEERSAAATALNRARWGPKKRTKAKAKNKPGKRG
jgi:hypothetical protein